MHEEAVDRFIASFERNPRGMWEILKASRWKVILGLTTIFAIDTVRVCFPVSQPRRLTVSRATGTPEGTSPFIDPKMDLEALFACLKTVQDVEQFLSTHTAFHRPYGAAEFLWQYRQDPKDFQGNAWHGPCNNFAEFAGTWAVQRGGIPYLVSLCPKGVCPKALQDWHQFVACKRTDGKFILFDNQSIHVREQALEDYIAQEYPHMEIAPVGGIIRWEKVQNDCRAKFIQHLVSPNLSSSDGMEEADIPLVPEESAYQQSLPVA